jgi:hypothetical protein
MAIFEVFYQPGKLFASLPGRRGVWILPLILGVILTLVAVFSVVHVIGMAELARQQIANTRLSPEQMQQALETAQSPAQLYITYTGAGIVAILARLLVAGGLAIFAMMGSRQPKFGTMFSMVTLAFLPYVVVTCLMTVLVVYSSPDPTALDSSNLLATNVGAFLNKDVMAKWLYTFFSYLDVLVFGEIFLLAYGFAKITRSGVFYGLVSVGTLFALYVALRMGVSALF